MLWHTVLSILSSYVPNSLVHGASLVYLAMLQVTEELGTLISYLGDHVNVKDNVIKLAITHELAHMVQMALHLL